MQGEYTILLYSKKNMCVLTLEPSSSKAERDLILNVSKSEYIFILIYLKL